MEKQITYTVRLTRAAHAFSEMLEEGTCPVFKDYQLFFKLKEIYKHPEGLYLRNKKLTVSAYRRTRNLLTKAQIISRDQDYANSYRVISLADLPADEIACLVDPFCYISHLSAMQRYGLTDRRPEALHITTPSNKLIKEFVQKKMENDYGYDTSEIHRDEFLQLTITHHPAKVRKRAVENFSTKYYGDNISIKGSSSRISTIGQTFLDMLDEPKLCGGMSHIIDIWKEHAEDYMQDIITAINGAPKTIHKVRAGYILEEIMGVNSPDINKWVKYAQRGGSRVLDPSKPFINQYSEKWMISINV
jgi:predicted transcriptional regulator of viral defense system